jgi:hypothetical protein
MLHTNKQVRPSQYKETTTLEAQSQKETFFLVTGLLAMNMPIMVSQGNQIKPILSAVADTSIKAAGPEGNPSYYMIC